ncbi:hypothetical protein N7523_006688 [Penicillium sp. IBT 18751x]|nr:hypothetical protein N7523_006688 [Penicillium sp. IBT 18751x]
MCSFGTVIVNTHESATGDDGISIPEPSVSSMSEASDLVINVLHLLFTFYLLRQTAFSLTVPTLRFEEYAGSWAHAGTDIGSHIVWTADPSPGEWIPQYVFFSNGTATISFGAYSDRYPVTTPWSWR